MGSKLDARCPYCGFSYKRDLRTQQTFRSVKDLLWSYSTDPKDWQYKRRHTVLGKWHQLKMQLWNEHIACCEALNAIADLYTQSSTMADLGREMT